MQSLARRTICHGALYARASAAITLRAALRRTAAQREWVGKGRAAEVLERAARAALGQRRLASLLSARQLLAARARAKKSRDQHVRAVAGCLVAERLSMMLARRAHSAIVSAAREHLCRAAATAVARVGHAARLSAARGMQAQLRMDGARREFVGAVAAARMLEACVRRAPVRGGFGAVVGASAAIRRCVYVCVRVCVKERGGGGGGRKAAYGGECIAYMCTAPLACPHAIARAHTHARTLISKSLGGIQVLATVLGAGRA